MEAIRGSGSHQSTFEPVTLYAKKSVKWIKNAIISTADKLNSIEVAIPLTVMSMIYFTVGLAKELFHMFGQVHSSDMLKITQKCNVMGVVLAPVYIALFIHSLVEISDATKAHAANAVAHAGLAAASAFADVVEIPAKIGSYVNLYQPVGHLSTWAPILFGVSALLSVANVIRLALSNNETRTFIKEAEGESLDAIYAAIRKRPLINLRFGRLGELRDMLFDEDGFVKNKKVEKDVLKTLSKITEALTKHPNNVDFQKIMNKYAKGLPALSEGEWRSLIDLGDEAYLECLKRQDPASLNIHFQADGNKLSVALEKIENISDQDKFMAIRKLKARVSYKDISDILSITSTLIGIVVQTAFVVTSFVASASPIAPILYGVLIILLIYSIAKMAIDHNESKVFQKVLKFDKIDEAEIKKKKKLHKQQYQYKTKVREPNIISFAPFNGAYQ